MDDKVFGQGFWMLLCIWSLTAKL